MGARTSEDGQVRVLWTNAREHWAFVVALWFTCAWRVAPQIVLAGAVGAGAQWLKVTACDESLRYSTECRYAFAIDAHLVTSVVLSFLLVFRARQAFTRFDDGKQAMVNVKEALRNVFAVVDVEYGNENAAVANSEQAVEYKRNVRRELSVLYAFIRQGIRDARIGANDDSILLERDASGTPSVPTITSAEERTLYGKVYSESRPEAATLKVLHDVQQLRLQGLLSERAAMEAYRHSQSALDAYRQAMLIVTTPTPREYSHITAVLLCSFVFSLPFAMTTLTDWTTPLVTATVAWLFYGVNEIAMALEDPFTWSLPAHALNVIGRRVAREIDAFSGDARAKVDEDDSEHSVDLFNAERRTKWYWFITDCFQWRNTTLPSISRQLFTAALVGMGAQLLKLASCGASVTESSQCLVTFDISAHRVLAISLSFLLVINTDWGYARYYGAKRLTIELQNALRSLVMCGTIFIDSAHGDDKETKMDMCEITRLADILHALARIAVRELIARDPRGKTLYLRDCFETDEYGGARKLCDLLTAQERQTLESLPVHAMTTSVAMKITALFEKYRERGQISDRFATEAYRHVCCATQSIQGFMRVVTTPVPKHFRHLLQVLLFFFVFTTPFVFSVSYQYITPVPAMLVALGFYGIAETSTAMMEPFNFEGPRHDLGELGTRMSLRHSRLQALALMYKGDAEMFTALVDESRELDQSLSLHGSVLESSRASMTSVISRTLTLDVKKASKLELEFKNRALKSMIALRSGWSFVTAVFAVQGTVLPRLAMQILASALVAIGANALKISECGDEVIDVTKCSYVFDASAHTMAGAILGFTLVFRVSFAYTRYYECKGLLGALANGVRSLNVAACTLMHQEPSRQKDDSSLAQDIAEIRRLSSVLVGLIRHVIRESRHGIVPFAITPTSPTSDELLLEDPEGWPSLSVLLTDDEKVGFAKANTNARVGICATKLMRIIDDRRRLGHISERGAFEMLGRVDACLQACSDMQRILSSVMPFAFLHVMNFATFFFTMTAPFVFITSYKWLAALPSMLVTMSLYGSAELGSLMEDPFSWSDPKHDLKKFGWALYTETLALHQETADVTPERRSLSRVASEKVRHSMREERRGADVDVAPSQSAAHSGVDAIVLTGAGAPQALKSRTVSSAIHKAHADFQSETQRIRYIRDLFRFNDTVFPWVWPQMLLVIFFGVGAQYYKLAVCGDDVTDHSECGVVFAPAASAIIGRILMFIIVYRFFFAFKVFYEAKTGVFAITHGVHLLNVKACAYMREGGGAKDTAIVRRALRDVLRLSGALFAAIRQSLREQRECDESDGSDASMRILLFDERASPALGVLLSREFDEDKNSIVLNDAADSDGTGFCLQLAVVAPRERVTLIAARILANVNVYRRAGYISDRAAATVTNTVRDILTGVAQCARAAEVKVPYALTHLINLILLIWMFCVASVIVVSFKYMTWLPLCILAVALYGLRGVTNLLENPFAWGKEANDLSAIGEALWTTCANTHAMCASTEKGRADIEELYADIEHKQSRIDETVREAYDDACTHVAAVAVSALKHKTSNAPWLFPPQRRFPMTRFSFINECFTIRGTVILPLVPIVIGFSSVAFMFWLWTWKTCEDANIVANRCELQISNEAHVLATPVLGFVVAYVLNLGYERYYSARSHMDDLYEHGRNAMLEMRVSFARTKKTLATKETDDDYARFFNALETLVAFMRQSLREVRVGYPDGAIVSIEDKDKATNPNTLLDDDFVGAPRLPELLSAEARNAFAGVAPHLRVYKSAGQVLRTLHDIRVRSKLHEKAFYRIQRSVQGMLRAHANCERIVTTPVPPFYMSSVYVMCFVFVLTAPLAFLSSYRWYVSIPTIILAFLVYGILRLARLMMNPFTFTAPSFDVGASARNIHVLSSLLALSS